MAINFVVGRPRQGKTMYLVILLRKFLLQGRTCYWQEFLPIDLELLLKPTRAERLRNWVRKIFRLPPLKVGKFIYYKSLKEFVNFDNGVIFMDEAQMYFNARKWNSLPDEFQWKLQQHGHYFLDIWGATQNIKRVDTLVRELINSVFLIKKIGRIFTVREYDLEDIDKTKREMYSFSVFFFSWRIAKSYDSFSRNYKKALTFAD